MDSISISTVFAVFCVFKISAEPPIPQGIKPSNVLGGSGQHASFSFVRPGLTQTSYSFNGPSSHQAFSSSIGNPNLAQKVLPNVANALAYRNPGLGFFQTGPITAAYASSNPQHPSQTGNPAPAPASAGQIVYQGTPALRGSEVQTDQTSALNAYLQQQYQQQYRQQYLQQVQQQYQTQNSQPQFPQQQFDNSALNAAYQAQLAQLHAYRQSQAQTQSSEQLQQLPEQIQLQQHQREQQQVQQQQQQPQQTQNLLGVAYSSAPSVAHVKVNGNGYNFDF